MPKKSLNSFLISYPCLPTPARPNTNLRFYLVNTFKFKLSDFSLTLNASAWFILMSCYPFLLGFYFHNILIYYTLIGYEGPKTLIILKNLSSILLNTITINIKLYNNLIFSQVEKVTGD